MKLPIAKLLPAAPNRNSHTHQLVMVYAKHGHGSRQASTGQRGPILQDSTYRKSQVTNALSAIEVGCGWLGLCVAETVVDTASHSRPKHDFSALPTSKIGAAYTLVFI